MPRGYRNIILAVAGLILLGASQPPKGGNQTENTETATKIDAAAKSISSAIIDAGKTSEQDGGCADGKDKRNSDLCAQWKAADAARDSADFAFWTLLISTMGTGLLVWTLWETRETSRREQRAYLRLEVHGEGNILPKERVFIPIHITNYGSTPAICCAVETSVAVALPDWDWSQNTAGQPAKDNRPAITIHPGPPTFVKLESAEILPQEIYNQIMSGQLVVFARCLVTYNDIFRRERHTRLHLEFHGSDAGPDGIGGKIQIAPKGNDFS